MDNAGKTLLSHQAAINRVIDFIESNIADNIELEHLAQVANMSKYHFTRVLNALMGETPMQLVARLRLEKIAIALISKPNRSISEICYEHGFTNMSVFAKAFKKQFGISATGWRKSKKSNPGKVIGNNGKSFQRPSMYFCQQSVTIKWRTQMKQNKYLEVREFQPFTVAYVRHHGEYQIDDAVYEYLWAKLYAWAAQRDYLSQKDLKSLIVYHDDPGLTAREKQRMSVCISVPENTRTDGEIGKMKIDGGKYVVAGFELASDEFPLAWDFIMCWFPSSGLEPRNGPSFELYPEQPEDGLFKVEICIPLKS